MPASGGKGHTGVMVLSLQLMYDDVLLFIQVTGAVGWRKDNLRYKKNEVFLDIVEQVC